MVTIDPKKIPSSAFHGYLLSAVVPRPIALASTVDHEGNINLSPFSFFNCFGYNPPILIFSPSRRGRDNTTKHTYENILEVPEVVINIVNYNMVQQTSLASTEYPKGVNEFTKAGLTSVPSSVVKPPRVEESPVSMECTVKQVVSTGDGGGAGILIICEIVLMHIKDEVIGDDGKIDPYKLDAVARLGGDYYARITGDAIFSVPKPLSNIGIGFDNLPEGIRTSRVLTGNDLGMLANVLHIPSKEEVEAFAMKEGMLFSDLEIDVVHMLAQKHLAAKRIDDAWKVLMAFEYQRKK